MKTSSLHVAMWIRRSRDYEDFIQKRFNRRKFSSSNPLRDRAATKSFHVSLEMSYLASDLNDTWATMIRRLRLAHEFFW